LNISSSCERSSGCTVLFSSAPDGKRIRAGSATVCSVPQLCGLGMPRPLHHARVGARHCLALAPHAPHGPGRNHAVGDLERRPLRSNTPVYCPGNNWTVLQPVRFVARRDDSWSGPGYPRRLWVRLPRRRPCRRSSQQMPARTPAWQARGSLHDHKRAALWDRFRAAPRGVGLRPAMPAFLPAFS
jgi:hypothetical protein